MLIVSVSQALVLAKEETAKPKKHAGCGLKCMVTYYVICNQSRVAAYNVYSTLLG